MIFRRIGLLPGSFDPPHAGHLALAERARDAAGLDQIFFFPNSLNADKPGLSPLHHRWEMVKLVLDRAFMALIPLAVCCDAAAADRTHDFLDEIERLRNFIANPCEVVMVRGSDYFQPQAATRYPPRLRAVSHVIGIREPAHQAYDFSALTDVTLVDCPTVSSTDMRARYRHDPLSPETGGLLGHYWHKHGLYSGRG